jgi:hypothetical protein
MSNGSEPATGDDTRASIGQRLVYALESLVELQVVTCVTASSFTIEADPSGSGLVIRPEAKGLKADSTFYTEINLVTGDINTVVPAGNAESGDPIRELHAANVEQGTEIVRANVAALKDVMAEFREEVAEWLGADSPRASG